MPFPSVYTYNFCPNPSFEGGITGASAILGATLFQDPGLAYTGSHSLLVSTPGNASGEGVTLPPGAILGTATGAIQFQIQGATPTAFGTLSVSAVDQTSSTVLGTTTVTFGPGISWQKVTITGLALVNAHNLAVLVETTTPQVTSFNIDAVQYEPSTSVNGGVLPTPYIDGDQVYGFWVGTAEASASYKLYQFQLSGSGSIRTAQLAASFLQQGEVFFLVNTNPGLGPTKIKGGIDASGKAFPGIQTTTPGSWGGAPLPVSGFGLVVQSNITTVNTPSGVSGYGAWTTDIDPAICFIGPASVQNSGIDTGGTPGYTRPFGTFSAPIAFTPPSTGVNVWNTARYFAVGFQLGSMANNVAQNISKVQAEIQHLNQATPSAYQRPRALNTIVSPTSQNMVQNPSFDGGTSGWTAQNSTLSIDTTAAETADGFLHTGSPTPHALQVSGTVVQFGAWMTVTGLIVGQNYTVSGYAWPYSNTVGVNGQLHDIQVLVGATTATGPLTWQALGSSVTGTVPATTPLTSWNGSSPVWYRPEVTFTATSSTMNFFFMAVPITGFAGTMKFNLDCVMVSPGDNALPYGDGYSSGWTWQTGGTPGNAPSYFYERMVVASQAVESVLAQHIPLGQYASQPVYNEPVTQFS